MGTRAAILIVAWLAVWGCARRTPPAPPAVPPEAGRAAAPEPPATVPDPLDRRVSILYVGEPLPRVISGLSKEPGVALAVAPSIPTAEWSGVAVALRMADVPVRAALDWVARPLGAQYCVEAGGSVWLSRTDDLLEVEPLEARSYRVPTHVVSRVPIRGALVYRREQEAVLDTLRTCLHYMMVRRAGCTLAFYGSNDLLVARLPGRGHARLAALLRAMRFGTQAPAPLRPSVAELRARLRTMVVWSEPAGPASRVLGRVAEAANVNLGWNPQAVAGRSIAIAPGRHSLQELLESVLEQTPLGRLRLEAGHGIWLCGADRRDEHPPSSASPWDRASVRAYDVGTALARLKPEEIVARLHKQVAPGQWDGGLPAAAVFVPTARLIVVHDGAGHRRVAAAVRNIVARSRRPAGPAQRTE